MGVASVNSFHHNNAYDDSGELKKEIREALGNIDGIEVFGEEVLVASYIMPQKTKGGIIIPGSTQKEDRWQSKVVMILKFGTDAIPRLQGKDSDEKYAKRFNGRPLEVGDWAIVHVQECWHNDIKGDGSKMRKDPNNANRPIRDWEGWPCRMVLINDIRGRTAKPEQFV